MFPVSNFVRTVRRSFLLSFEWNTSTANLPESAFLMASACSMSSQKMIHFSVGSCTIIASIIGILAVLFSSIPFLSCMSLRHLSAAGSPCLASFWSVVNGFPLPVLAYLAIIRLMVGSILAYLIHSSLVSWYLTFTSLSFARYPFWIAVGTSRV